MTAPRPARPAPQRIAVIGAGLVGLSSALWLQRDGHQVLLIDRNAPDQPETWKSAASFGNACTFAPAAVLPVAMPGILRDVPKMLADPDGPLALRWADLPALTPWLLRFIRASSPARVAAIASTLGALMPLASEAQEELLEDVGAQPLVRRNGLLYLYKTQASFDASRASNEMRTAHGVRMRVVSKDEIHAREPHLAPMYHTGIAFDDSWHFDTPYLYARALFDTFRARKGAFQRASVQGLTSTADGVRVETGETAQQFDRVVIACGAWSKPLAASAGDAVSLDTERGYHVLFPEAVGKLSGPVCYPDHGFYMTPTSEGLRCAGTVELGGLDKPPRRNRLYVIRRVAPGLVHGIGAPGREWMGFRPSMPDSLPVIGASPSDARILHAYGHGHIGLTLSAITGRLISDLAAGRPSALDLSPLRPDRF